MKHKVQDQKVICKRLWSKEEDNLLTQLVSTSSNPKWAVLAEQFNARIHQDTDSHIQRTNKQCRQRWQNHLNPSLNNHIPWSDEEHRTLFRLFREHSHKWCELAFKLEGEGFQKRSDNNIKNYFYSALKRQIKNINEVIRQNNKEIKKKKSQIHNYSQKYVYRQRLSLERQILEGSKQSVGIEENQLMRNEVKIEGCSNQGELDQNPFKIESDSLHIIKELDQDLISKILLIAEEKADKKYLMNHSHSLGFHDEAIQLRDQLIEIIINKDQPLDKEQVLKLSKQMLNISRICKRKNNKNINSSVNIQLKLKEATHTKKQVIEKRQQKIEDEVKSQEEQVQFALPPQLKDNKNPFPPVFNEKQTLDNLMQLNRERPQQNNNIDLSRSSMDFGVPHDDPFSLYSNNVAFIPSYDFSRNFMERSSELYGSNYFQPLPFHGVFGCYDPSPMRGYTGDQQVPQNSLSMTKKDSFINQIKEVKPTSVFTNQLVQSPQYHNPFPHPFYRANPFEQRLDPLSHSSQLIASCPFVVRKNSQQENKMNSSGVISDNISPGISRSMIIPERKSSLKNNLSNSNNIENPVDEWTFNLPQSNFHKFQNQ